MATPTQEITVTYAGYGVGGSTGRILEAYHTFEIGTETAAVEYSFIIPQTADSAALATAVAAAELAFNTPYAAFTVAQSGSTLLSFSHSSSTGFNSKPRIIKTESLADTGRSRRYVVRIDFGIPATNFGTSYRRSSQVQVTYDPSRRRHLKITAVYTANGSTAASTQALSAGPTYAGTVVTALTGTWEKIDESVDHDDQDKVATWTRTYDELIFSDGGSSNDAVLVGGKLTVAREKTAPGDYIGARRIVTLTLNYSCALDSSASTAILTKFDSVRSWFITQIQNTLGSGTLALMSETVTPDYPNNSLVVAMVAVGTSGGNVLEWHVETEDFREEGGVLVGVWSGQKFDKYAFQGPASYVRTETATQIVWGNISIGQVAGAGTGPKGFQGGTQSEERDPDLGPGTVNKIRVSLKPKVSHEMWGLPGNQIPATKIVRVTVTAFYTEPKRNTDVQTVSGRNL